jgi:hypothetical protein
MSKNRQIRCFAKKSPKERKGEFIKRKKKKGVMKILTLLKPIS